MDVDLQSLLGLHVTWCAQLHSLAEETPQLPHSPRIWTRMTKALLVSKDRRHLFVTPCRVPTLAASAEPSPGTLTSRRPESMANSARLVSARSGRAVSSSHERKVSTARKRAGTWSLRALEAGRRSPQTSVAGAWALRASLAGFTSGHGSGSTLNTVNTS